MWLHFRRAAVLLSCLLCAVLLVQPANAAEKKNFKVAWSIYVGWMPWDYANQSGILKKWADKYGIVIQLTQINDYIESINQYTAGSFDACVMTNMDALTVPAAGMRAARWVCVSKFRDVCQPIWSSSMERGGSSRTDANLGG